MNKWDKFLQEKGITKEQFAGLDADKMAEHTAEFQTKMIDEKVSKEDVDSMIKEAVKSLGDLATSKQIDDMNEILKKQGLTLQDMKRKGGLSSENSKTMSKSIKEAIEANKEGFKSLAKNPSASFNVTTKVAATMLTNTNTTGRVTRHENDDDRSKMQRRQPFVIEFVNSRPTNARVITYVERVNPDGAPAMTAEGALKPLVDFDYVERTAEVKKMAAFTKMSKEMMEDIDGFVSDTEDELTERLMLLFDEQLLTGDGTGQNLVGIEANATPFAAGNLATSIDNANNFDVLRAAIKQVVVNNFYPTVIFMNPEDIAQMELDKASDGHYLMPPFSSADGSQIKGIRIVENNGVTSGDFIVGDLQKFKVRVRENLNTDYGYENDDFRKNLISAVCEGRAASYIPANYFGAIVKGTFSAAKTALETI